MYQAPGVYREDIFPQPKVELRTGVPAFLGISDNGKCKEIAVNVPQQLTVWTQFEQFFGRTMSDSYLGCAVRGFFENGGRLCYVVRLQNATPEALELGLVTLEDLNTIDLVCAPDIMSSPTHETDLEQIRIMQLSVLDHCSRLNDRFAILDSPPQANLQTVLKQREELIDTYFAILDSLPQANLQTVLKQRELVDTYGALYYPWVRSQENGYFVPPCGHIAGVYARSDERIGIHKAPANEILEGVLQSEVTLTNAEQEQLNPKGINCLRAFPGRGIRVWGARTLSPNPNWFYVNVRRLFLTVGRWIELNMANRVFEPNNTKLWANIRRDLTAYFNSLFEQGALKGRSPSEAFYIKCDEETNPPEIRDAGKVIIEIGLAAAVPGEFVIIRIFHGVSGTIITEPVI